MTIIIQGLTSALFVTQGYGAGTPTTATRYPDPARATWAPSGPDASRATWATSGPDASRATWTIE